MISIHGYNNKIIWILFHKVYSIYGTKEWAVEPSRQTPRYCDIYRPTWPVTVRHTGAYTQRPLIHGVSCDFRHASIRFPSQTTQSLVCGRSGNETDIYRHMDHDPSMITQVRALHVAERNERVAITMQHIVSQGWTMQTVVIVLLFTLKVFRSSSNTHSNTYALKNIFTWLEMISTI